MPRGSATRATGADDSPRHPSPLTASRCPVAVGVGGPRPRARPRTRAGGPPQTRRDGRAREAPRPARPSRTMRRSTRRRRAVRPESRPLPRSMHFRSPNGPCFPPNLHDRGVALEGYGPRRPESSLRSGVVLSRSRIDRRHAVGLTPRPVPEPPDRRCRGCCRRRCARARRLVRAWPGRTSSSGRGEG
jgi:hypothetical protein